MADLRDVFPFILDECVGAPEPAMLRAVRAAAIELARESRVIVQFPDAVVVAPNATDYDLDLDDAYSLVAIKEAWMDGVRIDITTPERLASLGDWRSQSAAKPTAVLRESEGVVTVFPRPTNPQGAQITMRIVVAPTFNSLTLPDDIFSTYVEAIAAGALSRLQAQPGKPWSNPNFSMLNNSRFVAGKNVARVRANRDGGNELMVRKP